MNKFNKFLSETGTPVLKRRAANLAKDVEDSFTDYKRAIEKKIRAIEREVANLEDLSVKSTEDLVVGEGVNVESWVVARMKYALQLRDLEIELKTAKELIDEYFSDGDDERKEKADE